MNQCKYDRPWQSRCNQPAKGEFCEKHLAEKCYTCGGQSLGGCDYTGMFVCGAPMCAKKCHKHKDGF